MRAIRNARGISYRFHYAPLSAWQHHCRNLRPVRALRNQLANSCVVILHVMGQLTRVNAQPALFETVGTTSKRSSGHIARAARAYGLKNAVSCVSVFTKMIAIRTLISTLSPSTITIIQITSWSAWKWIRAASARPRVAVRRDATTRFRILDVVYSWKTVVLARVGGKIGIAWNGKAIWTTWKGGALAICAINAGQQVACFAITVHGIVKSVSASRACQRTGGGGVYIALICPAPI